MLGRRSSIVYSHSRTYLCHNRPRPSCHFEKLWLMNVSLSLLQTRLHPPLLNDQAIWENGLEPVLKKDNMINIDISTLKKKLTDSNPWASLCCTGRPPNRLSSSTACGGIGCERIRLQQMKEMMMRLLLIVLPMSAQQIIQNEIACFKWNQMLTQLQPLL